ncbi:MAG: two-component sensor histidine kinase [Saprospirales bacterium]|nr:two-component sensor histidine kinase [Saprospirales bacterium]|tara:strand:+ start:840 stop:1901 length:1062 start_codon:yes stop_codon:yes gene_type:complete
MAFKNLKLRQVSLLISLTVATVSGIALCAEDMVDGWSFQAYMVVIPLILLVTTFPIAHYFVDLFIYRRIKILYKLVSTEKGRKELKNSALQEEDDFLQAVEEEVRRYSTSKQSEIQALKRMETYRKEFIGNVSHELKTPIFNAQGYIETLLDGGMEDREVNIKYLEKATRNLDRLANIVEDLIMLNQYETDSTQLDTQFFDITELTKQVIDEQELLASKKNIELVIKEDAGFQRKVFADRKHIHHVLSNLVNNSIKYGHENGLTKIGFYDVEDKLLIEVSDNGPGIANEHLARLFERFYRVDKARSRGHGGTGLGLAICKHIVEAHKEKIHVRSSLDVGTTFGFTLSTRALEK